MTVIGILFEKRNVDDSGFLRTPDRPVELLGTNERYPRSVKTTIGACGPDFLGGSAAASFPNSSPIPNPACFGGERVNNLQLNSDYWDSH